MFLGSRARPVRKDDNLWADRLDNVRYWASHNPPRPVTDIAFTSLLSIFCAGRPLRSSGQSFWPHIQRSGFDSLRYHIFWEIVSLERGPLRLVSTIKELLERKSSCSGLEIRDYGRRGSAALTTLHPAKFVTSLRRSDCCSFGKVHSRTKSTELLIIILFYAIPFNMLQVAVSYLSFRVDKVEFCCFIVVLDR
jgi:hypothetical protein